MIWCLYFLTKHPEIQEKVFAELEEVLGDEDIKPQVVPELKLVNCFIMFTPNCNNVVIEKGKRQIGINYIANRPFPSCLLPLFQNESKCETIQMKMSLIYMKWTCEWN